MCHRSLAPDRVPIRPIEPTLGAGRTPAPHRLVQSSRSVFPAVRGL